MAQERPLISISIRGMGCMLRQIIGFGVQTVLTLTANIDGARA